MKKILSLTTILFLALLVLTGCQTKGKGLMFERFSDRTAEWKISMVKKDKTKFEPIEEEQLTKFNELLKGISGKFTEVNEETLKDFEKNLEEEINQTVIIVIYKSVKYTNDRTYTFKMRGEINNQWSITYSEVHYNEQRKEIKNIQKYRLVTLSKEDSDQLKTLIRDNVPELEF